jgi:serine/threonine-protein phosphatase PGAM5
MTPNTNLQAHQDGTALKQVKGTTRHIILVRHGQYDETSQDDKLRILTDLGRRQAEQTGRRLAQIAKGSQQFKDDKFNGPCSIKSIRVSDMTRAKETAELIAEQLQLLPGVLQAPDASLNEALPSPMIPVRPDIPGATEEIDKHHDRIEQAFQKYFYRSAAVGDDDADMDIAADEFEVIVCHGNVIRYFFCRALQLPPEAWLRSSIFNCSLTYLVIRPNGTVSARMLGDIGHLDYDDCTFSGNYGFKW